MLIPGFISNILEWSQLQVKNCFLPDKRLVPVMENFLIAHAANPRGSTAEVSNGNDALKKILYRACCKLPKLRSLKNLFSAQFLKKDRILNQF